MSIYEKYPNSIFLRKLTQASHHFDTPNRLQELFSYLDGLEDSSFGTSLDADPDSRIWEMMVAKILKSSGFNPTSSDSGPDFHVIHDGKNVFVEAICPTTGQDGLPNSVPPLKMAGLKPSLVAPILHHDDDADEPLGKAQRSPIDSMLLRICAAMRDKKAVFKKYLEDGIVSPSDSCVIAISSTKLGWGGGLQPRLGITATLGHGRTYALFDQGSGGAVKEGFELKNEVLKANQSAVGTLAFLDDDNSMISGVLYSDASFSSLTFDLFGETVFIHNPKATQPVPLGIMRCLHEIWTIRCLDDSVWKSYELKRPT